MRSIVLVIALVAALIAPAFAQKAEVEAVNAKWIKRAAMSASLIGHSGSSASAMRQQVLPARVALMRALPMDCWITGARENPQWESQNYGG
jgi:hypothetical protein